VSPLDGIPVWPLAAVQCLPAREIGICYAMTTAGKPLVMVRDGNGLQPSHHDLPWLLDLSNPDTRAAYDRRLALALGAPDYLVERGVGVSVSDDEHVIVRAGFYDNPNSDWHHVAHVGTTDPLLARALAWPADKRSSP
jgi:hypothetical protein